MHGFVAYFDYVDQDTGIVVMILLFLTFYYNSTGPIAWMYAAETTIDVALGISLLVLWGSACILSIVSPILMDDDVMGPTNVFIMFSAFSVGGAVYAFVFIKETINLTDKEKKELYLTEEQKAKLAEIR